MKNKRVPLPCHPLPLGVLRFLHCVRNITLPCVSEEQNSWAVLRTSISLVSGRHCIHATLADSPFSPTATKPRSICSTYGATQTSSSLPAITNNVICGLHGVGIALGQLEKWTTSSYIFYFKIDLYTENINTSLIMARRSETQTHLKPAWEGNCSQTACAAFPFSAIWITTFTLWWPRYGLHLWTTTGICVVLHQYC